MIQQTIEKLHALHLGAFADALRDQTGQSAITDLPFEDRLAILVDLQHSAMLNAALTQCLKRAGMRQSACLENLDLRPPPQYRSCRDRGTGFSSSHFEKQA